MESDGSEICDDECLQCFAQEKSTFMILDVGEEWQSNHILATIVNNSLMSTQDSHKELQSSQQSIAIDLPTVPTVTDTISSFCSDIFDIRSPSPSLNSTLTMSSTAISMSSEANIECTKAFSNFQIPWNKLPSFTLNQLNCKEKLGKSVNIVGNVIVDELRLRTFYIPMKILHMVAEQAASRYPESFIEKDTEGNIISTTPVALINVMKNRNNFLNRRPKREKSEFEPKIPIKHRRCANILKNTCQNWQPKSDLIENTADETQYKRQYLIKLHNQDKISSEDQKIVKDYMKACFPALRLFLNNGEKIPTVKDTLEMWPFLFKKEIIYDHFNDLMKMNCEGFKETFSSEKERLIKFFKASKKKEILRLLGKEEDEFFIIKAIFAYFNEDYSYLFEIFKVKIV